MGTGKLSLSRFDCSLGFALLGNIPFIINGTMKYMEWPWSSKREIIVIARQGISKFDGEAFGYDRSWFRNTEKRNFQVF